MTGSVARTSTATNVSGTATCSTPRGPPGSARFVLVSSPSVAHAGSALAGAGADPADPGPARGSLLAQQGPRRARRPSPRTGPQVRHSRSGRTWCGVRATPSWSGASSSAPGPGGWPSSAAGAALIDTTYVDNAVEALVAALDRAPAGHGQAFVVSNGEPRTVAELVERICAGRPGSSRPTRSVPLAGGLAGGPWPSGLWRLARRTDDPPMTRFLAEQLATAHWFDQRRTREVLGWAPRVSLERGLRPAGRRVRAGRDLTGRPPRLAVRAVTWVTVRG